MYPLSDSTAAQYSQYEIVTCSPYCVPSRILTECVLLPVSLPTCADRRTLQTEVCGPARCTRPIAALVYVSANVAVVVKRLDQARVSICRWLAGGFEEILNVFWTPC